MTQYDTRKETEEACHGDETIVRVLRRLVGDDMAGTARVGATEISNSYMGSKYTL